MDEKSCNWSEARFKEIKGEVEKMLTKIGYKVKKIPFIPMSGFLGVNLTDKGNAIRDEKMKWYKGWNCTIKKKKLSGMTLLDALNTVAKPPKRDKKKPFRMPVSGVYKIKGDLVEMSKNKYAKNFIKRIMDQGTKEQREVIMASFSAHVPELAKHADASKVLDYGVSNFSNASQRQAMVEEFYGPSYAFHKTSEHQSLEELLNEKPEARNSILDFMKAKVLSHVEKQSFTTLVVQKATLEFLRLCSVFAKPEARQEVIERAW